MMAEEPSIKYQNIGQVGAMGDGARANFLRQNQGAASADGALDYPLLLEQLKALRDAVGESDAVSQDEKDLAIAAIQNARQAATEKNPSKVVTSLQKMGGWAVAVAERTGIYLVAGLIKDGLHHH